MSGNIFVTYAKQDAAKKDDVPGGGRGYVDEFTPAGKLVARVASGGRKNAPPNAPWGLALAPSSFGPFSGDVLVGNFGNGRISAYQKRGAKWVYKGQLRRGNGTLIAIDGLWAIAFGNGSAAGPTTSLYFLAGPGGEAHGLFGSIMPADRQTDGVAASGGDTAAPSSSGLFQEMISYAWRAAHTMVTSVSARSVGTVTATGNNNVQATAAASVACTYANR